MFTLGQTDKGRRQKVSQISRKDPSAESAISQLMLTPPPLVQQNHFTHTHCEREKEREEREM